MDPLSASSGHVPAGLQGASESAPREEPLGLFLAGSRNGGWNQMALREHGIVVRARSLFGMTDGRPVEIRLEVQTDQPDRLMVVVYTL